MFPQRSAAFSGLNPHNSAQGPFRSHSGTFKSADGSVSSCHRTTKQTPSADEHCVTIKTPKELVRRKTKEIYNSVLMKIMLYDWKLQNKYYVVRPFSQINFQLDL